MLGCTVDEMLGRPTTDFLDDDEARKVVTLLAGRRRGMADQYELKWRAPDGREVWTIMNASPLFDPDGSYAGAFAMATDISERVWQERAVRASEERYRNIIETTTEGVWMIDGEHRTTYVNRRMAQMLGYRVEEMLGRPVSDFMPDGDVAGLGHDPGGAGGRPREVRYVRKDGSGMWGLLSGSPLADAAGGYGGALAMIADITERKRSEESVARLAAIVESSPDAIFSTDLEGKITSWNSAAERIYGYTEEEVLGQTGWMLVLPERLDEAREVGRTMLSGGSVIDFPSKARTKDGRKIDIAPSVSAIRSEAGEVVGTLTIVREVAPPG
jgi:PAS domain S-box-containing protein